MSGDLATGLACSRRGGNQRVTELRFDKSSYLFEAFMRRPERLSAQ